MLAPRAANVHGRSVPRILGALLFLIAGVFPSPLQAQHAATSNALSQAESDARKFQLAPGLHLQVWAAEPQLENPVAFSLVPGPASPDHASSNQPVTAFVAETHRYGTSILDITQNTPWLLNDLSFRGVPDRAEFLTYQFATNAALLTRDSELIRRVADPLGTHRTSTSEIFAAGFQSVTDGTAAGILARGTNVWFANIPNLWRLGLGLSTNNGASSRTALATGFGVHIGVTGHDLHGLTLGPDGRIYMSFGDRGLSVTNREGILLDVPDTGGVLRCEPDGRYLEIFCLGLRNPQELSFDDAGNLFTVDNDTAGADDCRVLHLLEGADYGWRASYQHMKGFGPWVAEGLWRGDLDGALPLAGTVSQGPAGLAFYPGTGFGGRFNGRFLHCDFPGGVWSFSLRPSGATFRVDEKQKILWNCWPTDVEFGPDGALYVLDWVAGWEMPKRGRIYRIEPDSLFATGTVGPSAPPSRVDLVGGVYEILRDGLARRNDSDLLDLLGHLDYRVRLAAQFELADRGPASLQPLARATRDSSEVVVRRHALWAMSQILRRNPPDGTVLYGEELAAADDAATDLDSDTRIQALRLLGDFSAVNHRRSVSINLQRGQPTDRVRCEARIAAAKMAAPGHHTAISLPAHQRLLWRIAGVTHTTAEAQRLGILQAVPLDFPGLEAALQAGSHVGVDDDPFERFALAFAMTPLSGREIAAQVATRRDQPELFVMSRRAGLLALRRAGAPEIAQFLADPDPRLRLEAARSINDVPIPEAYPALAALLTDPSIHAWENQQALSLQPARSLANPRRLPTNAPPARPARDQVLRRALNAHFRLGHATNAIALAEFASAEQVPSGTAVPTDLRAEALFLLGAWEILPASPGHVPTFPKADPNHGAVPTVNPENWPGWFDRVVGLWRPLSPRPADPARAALSPRLDALISDSNPDVALAALEACVRLRLTNGGPALVARFLDPRTPRDIRHRTPAALASLDGEALKGILPAALNDMDPEIQASALPFLDRLAGSEGVKLLTEKLRIVLSETNPPKASLRLGQSALTALGNSKSPEALPPLRQAAALLLAGKLPAGLELDLIEAARHHDDSELRSALLRRESDLPRGDALAAARESLFGGDAARGRTIFFERPEAQCSRCHKIKGEGGIVGPALDGLATRRDRRYFLESILQPNAQIAQGFENVLVTTRDGRELAGTVRSEDDSTLTLATVDAGEIRIQKPDITERRHGLSAMPEGLGESLPRRDLRDLIEFLATLK